MVNGGLNGEHWKMPEGFGERVKFWTVFKEKEKNINWNNGASFEPYGEEFNTKLKEKVRDLFKRKCIECGFPEEQLNYKLHIHHIDYNKKNNQLTNLVPLCRQCHSQTLFGRKDWTNYFKDKIYGDHTI